MSVPMKNGGMSKIKALAYTMLSGVTTGIGAFFGALVGQISEQMISICLSIAAGAMLYIVSGELIPESNSLYKGRIGFIGNIIPIYFIVKFIQPLFKLLSKIKIFKKIIDWASDKAIKHIEESERLQNFTALGLFLFVAIPLPGTGAWVGSLIANFLHVPVKKAWFPLTLGVLTAGIIVLLATGSVVTIFEHI